MKWYGKDDVRLPDIKLGDIALKMYCLLEFRSYLSFLLVEEYGAEKSEKTENQRIYLMMCLDNQKNICLEVYKEENNLIFHG